MTVLRSTSVQSGEITEDFCEIHHQVFEAGDCCGDCVACDILPDMDSEDNEG